MPIMAKTDDKKPAPAIGPMGGKATESAREMAEKGRDMARDVAETTISMAEQTAAKTEAVTDQVAGRMSQLANATPRAVNDLSDFWRDLAKAQVAYNIDMFRRLAAARNWQDYFDLQTSYVSGNVTRMGDAAFRYASMTGAMMSRLVMTGGRQSKNAG